jgi:hypothetical protein
MHTVQLELSDELAETLTPYRDKLSILLELGLQEWLKREQGKSLLARERVLRVLAGLDQVKVPRPYTDEKPYVRHTPVPITGKSVSKIVVEQRGEL